MNKILLAIFTASLLGLTYNFIIAIDSQTALIKYLESNQTERILT